jgi:FTR1 family protein
MVITLREGGETSLILALLFSSLKAARHVAYRAAAWTGFALALALSVLAGVLLHDLGQLGAIFEGSLAWIGAGFIASLAIQLHQNAVDYRSQLKHLRDSAGAERASWATALAVGSFAFVSVIREGLETAVFLSNGAGLRSEGGWLGAGVGLSLAAAFGISIYLGFRKLNIRSFMRTTEILLFALVISLFLSGLHEFSEARLLSMPRSLDLFQLTWIQSGLFLQLLLCAGPFLYVAMADGPPRDYIRAAGVAIFLTLVPVSLGRAARMWEHARLAPMDRTAATKLEQTERTRTQSLLATLGDLQAAFRAGDVQAARSAWVAARCRFVQVEPLLARADREMTDELNGEPGEAAGYHGVEAALFQSGTPWIHDHTARAALESDLEDLIARNRIAAAKITAMPLDPATVRAAWTGMRWTLLGRSDGQESPVAQSSILEWGSTLDAIDADLETQGTATAPIRSVLGPALAEAARGPRYGESLPETHTPAERLHLATPISGPDRAWDRVDRAALRRAIDESFERLAAENPGIVRSAINSPSR